MFKSLVTRFPFLLNLALLSNNDQILNLLNYFMKYLPSFLFTTPQWGTVIIRRGDKSNNFYCVVFFIHGGRRGVAAPDNKMTVIEYGKNKGPKN